MISIFTPFHKTDTTYLHDLYLTLLEQTFTDWEWVLVPNGEGVNADLSEFNDQRVKVYPYVPKNSGYIGELKNYACKMSKGDILVEADWDDLFTPDCLEEISKAFDDDTTMVYSNFAQINMDWTPNIWSTYWGWEFKDFEYKGHKIKEAVSPEVYPSNLGRIWYAPNHVRAWKTKDYWRIGGHDISMKISDDHDIVARHYIEGKIKKIDKCLYIYRVHGDNTWLQVTKEIQDTMWDNYVKYIFPMMERWCDDNKLLKIDLCGGINKKEGYTSMDLQNADIIGDLDETWKLDDNSVGLIYANDAVEHLKDPIHTMNEAYRVLKDGGYFIINVPSTDGMGAWCDPTHKSFWNIRSFKYYTDPNMRKFIEPMCNCKFQVMKLCNGTLNDLPYVFAHLTAYKGLRLHGENKWQS